MYTVYKLTWFSRYTLYSLIVFILAAVYGVLMIKGFAEPGFLLAGFMLLSLFILFLSLRKASSFYALSEEDFSMDQWFSHVRLNLTEMVVIRIKSALLGKFLEIQTLRGRFFVPLSSIRNCSVLIRMLKRRVSKLEQTEREELDLDD